MARFPKFVDIRVASRSKFVPFLVILGATAACGDDDGSGLSNSPIASEDFCARILELRCEAEQECCMDPAGRRSSVDECLADEMPGCQSGIADVAGDARTGYDEAEAGRFVARYGGFARSCDTELADFYIGEDGVFSVFQGTVGEGGDCTPATAEDLVISILACERPLACALRMDPDTRAFVGTCQARVGLGGACATALECEDGLRCDDSVEPGACASRLANGSDCAENGDCQSFLCDQEVCVEPTASALYCESSDTGP